MHIHSAVLGGQCSVLLEFSVLINVSISRVWHQILRRVSTEVLSSEISNLKSTVCHIYRKVRRSNAWVPSRNQTLVVYPTLRWIFRFWQRTCLGRSHGGVKIWPVHTLVPTTSHRDHTRRCCYRAGKESRIRGSYPVADDRAVVGSNMVRAYHADVNGCHYECCTTASPNSTIFATSGDTVVALDGLPWGVICAVYTSATVCWI